MGIERRTLAAMSVVGFLAAPGFCADEGSTQGDGADVYQGRWGPAVGAAIPNLAAEDQDGDVRDYARTTRKPGNALRRFSALFPL